MGLKIPQWFEVPEGLALSPVRSCRPTHRHIAAARFVVDYLRAFRPMAACGLKNYRALLRGLSLRLLVDKTRAVRDFR